MSQHCLHELLVSPAVKMVWNVCLYCRSQRTRLPIFDFKHSLLCQLFQVKPFRVDICWPGEMEKVCDRLFHPPCFPKNNFGQMAIGPIGWISVAVLDMNIFQKLG